MSVHVRLVVFYGEKGGSQVKSEMEEGGDQSSRGGRWRIGGRAQRGAKSAR